MKISHRKSPASDLAAARSRHGGWNAAAGVCGGAAGCPQPPGASPVPPHRKHEAGARGTRATPPQRPTAKRLGVLQGGSLGRRDTGLSPHPLAFCPQPPQLSRFAAPPAEHVQPPGEAGGQRARQKPAAPRAGSLAAGGDSNSAETQPPSFDNPSHLLSHPGQTPVALTGLLRGGSRQTSPPVSKPPRPLSLLCGAPGTTRLLAGATGG